MAGVLVDERDIRFVLFEQLKIQDLCTHERFTEFSLSLLEMILKEAQKFAENILLPLNLKGDREGARFEGGKVFSTPGTREAYGSFVEGGWLSSSDDKAVGGQEMPHVILSATHEMFFAANFPFMCYVNLTHDAAKLIEIFGSQEQKKLYMEPMFEGRWTGTMALTEPGAGSDVGNITLKAKSLSGGIYSLSGNKTFITNGEHDVAENIVHLVLARIEGDPSGTKGLSLFIVPKIRVDENGALGRPNDVTCTGVEEKMGLHASPTTALNFGENGDCQGTLLGRPREGIQIMFHMMNSSRLEVGLWGQATASVSYLQALMYARERRQGRNTFKPGDSQQVLIIEHPDIRRSLLLMKSYVEGMRALMYYCGYAMDRQKIAADGAEEKKWARLIDLLIPICKAYPTEKGVELASLAIQVLGGYGYCREYRLEQVLRDAKAGCLFEGTTGIQAMDLTLRKLAMDEGQVFADFMSHMDRVIEPALSQRAWQNYASELKETKTALSGLPALFSAKLIQGQAAYPFLQATPFLEAFSEVILGWLLLWGGLIAEEKLEVLFQARGAKDPEQRWALIDENKEAAYLDGKVKSAKYFLGNVLPITRGKIKAAGWGDLSPWEIRESSFGV